MKINLKIILWIVLISLAVAKKKNAEDHQDGEHGGILTTATHGVGKVLHKTVSGVTTVLGGNKKTKQDKKKNEHNDKTVEKPGSDVDYKQDVVDTDTESTDEKTREETGSDGSDQHYAEDTGSSDAESKPTQEYETSHKKGNSDAESKPTHEYETSHDKGESKRKPARRKLYPGQDCYRDCTKYPESRVCYFPLAVESYPTMNTACTLCTPNPNITNYAYADNCTCILSDGYDKVATVFNRKIPGTGINVCRGDIIVADVKNYLECDTAVHWHGMLQEGTQYMDGVPFITQCPILPGTTFRYEFVAKYPGTYWYHSHHALQTFDGMAGALVIRDPKERDPHCDLYDVDMPEYTIIMQDILHRPANAYFPGTTVHDTGSLPVNVLLNGCGTFTDPATGNVTATPLARFIVEQGKRYRFRVICAFASTCPAQMTMQGHNMTLIATDGHAVDPVNADTINLLAAERYDWVLDASNEIDTYYLQVKLLGGCAANKIQQLAMVQYVGAPDTPSTPAPTYDDALPTTVIINALDGNCSDHTDGNICVDELSNVNKSSGLHEFKPDMTLYMSLGVLAIDPSDYQQFYSPKNHTIHEVLGQRPFIAHTNGIQFKLPPSPPISQWDDLDSSCFCSRNNPTNSSEILTCTHKIDLPLNKTIRFCVFDQGLGGGPHAMHVHGNRMMMKMVGTNNTLGVPVITLENLKEAVENNKIDKPYKRGQRIPPYKDTFALPNRGFAIFTMTTFNPGWWIFHCHFNTHNMIGLDALWHVGKNSDLSPVPKNFPKCGNFVNAIKALEPGFDKY